MTQTLPLVEAVAQEGTCCAACAAQQAAPRPALPVVQPARAMISRGTDRQITFAGVLVAAGFLGFAGLGAIGSALGGAVWLPLHLAMAGAAGTAIAAVLPFFTTALAQAAPARPDLRIGSIVLMAGGTVVAGLGMNGAGQVVSVAGGGAYVGGVATLAVVAFLPLRRTLGFRLRLVHLAYGVALAQVGTGVVLATAMLAGWAPVASRWAALKPAHAWLNVFGFVTVVIAASLVHLAPTVAGARIRPRRSADVALVGLMTGAPLVALAFAIGWDAVGRVGAAVEVVGAAALLVHGASVERDRGIWTTDSGWHRFAQLSLLAAPAWLLVAVIIAGGRVLWLGATPAAWSLTVLVVPLVAGGIGQVLVGAWTHIVPAIGPGDQARHAIQRGWLGRGALARWSAWNVGAALATIGVVADAEVLRLFGALAIGASLAGSLFLLVKAVRQG
jgi:nitrite reductase (NO-forming)